MATTTLGHLVDGVTCPWLPCLPKHLVGLAPWEVGAQGGGWHGGTPTHLGSIPHHPCPLHSLGMASMVGSRGCTCVDATWGASKLGVTCAHHEAHTLSSPLKPLPLLLDASWGRGSLWEPCVF